MTVKDEIINIDKLGNPAITQLYQPKQKLHFWNAFAYALLYVAIAATIAFVFNITIIPGGISIKEVLIPGSILLLSGVVFVFFLYTKLNFLNNQNPGSGFWYSCIVSAGVFLVTYIIRLIKAEEDNSIVTCLFYSCLFLLPYTIYQTWLYYKNILGVNIRKVWYLPALSSQVPTATVFLNSIRIKIKIAPTQGAAERIYETTVPGRLSLGNMFSHFVYDVEKNAGESFELKDEENHMYGWQFMTTSFFGINRRAVDAELSLNENKIKSNTVIFARRVKPGLQTQIQLNN